MGALTLSRKPPTLPFGDFYGTMDRRFQSAGMEIALLGADPHRMVERHSHDDAHFVFVLEGLYISKALGAPPVSAGPALIFNPAGTMHRDWFEARERVMNGRFLTVSIAAELVDAASLESGVSPHAVAVDCPQAIELAAQLAAVLLPDGSGTAIAIESLVLALMAEVATGRARPSRHAPAWLRIARERLDDALGEDIRIGDVARAAGVHPVHLARVFRQFMGMTPGAYLRQRRVEHARTLLRETRRSMSEIALACGYADQSHFTNAFRGACRATPRAFRQG